MSFFYVPLCVCKATDTHEFPHCTIVKDIGILFESILLTPPLNLGAILNLVINPWFYPSVSSDWRLKQQRPCVFCSLEANRILHSLAYKLIREWFIACLGFIHLTATGVGTLLFCPPLNGIKSPGRITNYKPKSSWTLSSLIDTVCLLSNYKLCFLFSFYLNSYIETTTV